jgi:hypothetical protein
MRIGTITTQQAICVDFLVTINVPMDACRIEFFLAITNLKDCGSEKIPSRTRSEIPTRMHISQSYVRNCYRYITVGWQ